MRYVDSLTSYYKTTWFTYSSMRSVVYEQELSDYHWLRVYHVLVQKRQELDTTADKPVYRCDEVRSLTHTHTRRRTHTETQVLFNRPTDHFSKVSAG